jgi:S-adenosylmethionine/arginine decarboxylase-like enzyme
MTGVLQHKHLIFRIETPTPPTDVIVLENWMKSLINKVGMELYAGPVVKYLNEVGNRGLTGVCVIKTSHLALHCWDEPSPGIIQFDIYSCGQLNIEDVLEELQAFNPSKIEYKFLDRESGLKLIGDSQSWKTRLFSFLKRLFKK